MDFEHDLKNEIHSIFIDFGIRIPIRRDVEEMIVDYLTLQQKLVLPKPRLVSVSSNLKAKLDNGIKQKEINHLIQLFISGQNVNFYQSKRLFQTKFHDHLVYEWKIHHFHLGNESKRKSPFISETKQLLFVYVEEERAAFLDVDAHREGVFADTKWLEILHDNFPDILEKYLAEDILDVLPNNLSAGDVQTLWNKGYNIGMSKVRDKVYFSPGLGRMTNGVSMQVMVTTGRLYDWIKRVSYQFNNYLPSICNELNLDLNLCQFKLVIGPETFQIIEANKSSTILKFPIIFSLPTGPKP